jgi:hypothetical protein
MPEFAPIEVVAEPWDEFAAFESPFPIWGSFLVLFSLFAGIPVAPVP